MFFLYTGIKTLLEGAFLHHVFREPGQDEQYTQPRFFIGALPPKRSNKDDENQDFPFVIIRGASGEDGEGESDINIIILCGLYTESDVSAGAHDIQNMIDICRRALLAQRTIDQYRLELPLKWSLGDSDDAHIQPYPYNFGRIISTWKRSGIMEVFTPEEEERIYGG